MKSNEKGGKAKEEEDENEDEEGEAADERKLFIVCECVLPAFLRMCMIG